MIRSYHFTIDWHMMKDTPSLWDMVIDTFTPLCLLIIWLARLYHL